MVGTADSLAQDGVCRLFEVFDAEDVGESHGCGLICSVIRITRNRNSFHIFNLHI